MPEVVKELTPKEALEARKAKQAMHIEMMRADPEVEELPLTPKDHKLCKAFGHPNALLKFRRKDDGMVTTFCDLTPMESWMK